MTATLCDINVVENQCPFLTAFSSRLNVSISIFFSVSPRENTVAIPRNQTVNHGDTAKLNCTAEGGPDTVFKWFYNGTQSQCLDCSVIQANTTTDIDGK